MAQSWLDPICEGCGQRLDSFDVTKHWRSWLINLGLLWVVMTVGLVFWDALRYEFPEHFQGWVVSPLVAYPVMAVPWTWVLGFFVWSIPATREAKQHREHTRPDWKMWLVPPLFGLCFAVAIVTSAGIVFLLFSGLAKFVDWWVVQLRG